MLVLLGTLYSNGLARRQPHKRQQKHDAATGTAHAGLFREGGASQRADPDALGTMFAKRA